MKGLIDWVPWIFISLLELLLSSYTVCGQLVTPPYLEALWAIQKPIVTYDSSTDTFVFDYAIHADMDVADNLRVNILDPDCNYPEITDGVLLDTFTTGGQHVFQIEPQIMANNPIIYSEIPGLGQIRVCLRFELWTGPTTNPSALEVNFLETILTLYIDLTAGFAVEDFLIEYKDNARSETLERHAYEVFAYRCYPDTLEEVETTIVNQGEVVTVCVEVEERAIQEGVFLERIDEFTWIREYGNVFNLTQVVMWDGLPSDDGLTEYNCIPGLIVCPFHSLPKAYFFMTSGEMYGIGQATLRFGAAPGVGVRGLQQQKRQQQQRMLRNLEEGEDDIADAASAFKMTLDMHAMDDLPERLQTAASVVPIVAVPIEMTVWGLLAAVWMGFGG